MKSKTVHNTLATLLGTLVEILFLVISAGLIIFVWKYLVGILISLTVLAVGYQIASDFNWIKK